jgi:hypothetical protein
MTIASAYRPSCIALANIRFSSVGDIARRWPCMHAIGSVRSDSMETAGAVGCSRTCVPLPVEGRGSTGVCWEPCADPRVQSGILIKHPAVGRDEWNRVDLSEASELPGGDSQPLLGILFAGHNGCAVILLHHAACGPCKFPGGFLGVVVVFQSSPPPAWVAGLSWLMIASASHGSNTLQCPGVPIGLMSLALIRSSTRWRGTPACFATEPTVQSLFWFMALRLRLVCPQYDGPTAGVGRPRVASRVRT